MVPGFESRSAYGSGAGSAAVTFGQTIAVGSNAGGGGGGGSTAAGAQQHSNTKVSEHGVLGESSALHGGAPVGQGGGGGGGG